MSICHDTIILSDEEVQHLDDFVAVRDYAERVSRKLSVALNAKALAMHSPGMAGADVLWDSSKFIGTITTMLYSIQSKSDTDAINHSRSMITGMLALAFKDESPDRANRGTYDPV